MADKIQNMTDKEKKRRMALRIVYYIIGTVVMAFGVALSIRAEIGVAPGTVIAAAAAELTPLTIGQSTACFNVFCVLVQIAITRRPTLNHAFQFPMAYVFGFILDIFYDMLELALPNIFYSLLYLVIGIIIFSIGIRILVGANILMTPPDALAKSMGASFGWPMSKAKLIFDIAVTVIAALLTFILVGNPLLVVGIGTLLCALATGPLIGLFTKLFPFFDVG